MSHETIARHILKQVDSTARHVDAWVLVYWVLGRAIPDADKWELLARRRLYGTTECASTIHDHEDSLKYVTGITASMTSTMASWTKHFTGPQASALANRQSCLLVAEVSRLLKLSRTHPSFNSCDAVKSTISAHTYQWARFIAQSKVTVYYDDTEHIGVRLCDSEAQVDCGEEIWALCGGLENLDESIVRAPLEEGVRWSYYGSNPIMYLSGPISMINHACRLHFNVSLQKMRAPSWACTSTALARGHSYFMVAVAERRIEAKDNIYVVYDDDESSLLASRGISCLICAKVKNVV